MKVFLNETEKVVEAGICISSLLVQLNLHTLKGTAIAINGEIVPSDSWQKTMVKENDHILMIEAVQGG